MSTLVDRIFFAYVESGFHYFTRLATAWKDAFIAYEDAIRDIKASPFALLPPDVNGVVFGYAGDLHIRRVNYFACLMYLRYFASVPVTFDRHAPAEGPSLSRPTWPVIDILTSNINVFMAGQLYWEGWEREVLYSPYVLSFEIYYQEPGFDFQLSVNFHERNYFSYQERNNLWAYNDTSDSEDVTMIDVL